MDEDEINYILTSVENVIVNINKLQHNYVYNEKANLFEEHMRLN